MACWSIVNYFERKFAERLADIFVFFWPICFRQLLSQYITFAYGWIDWNTIRWIVCRSAHPIRDFFSITFRFYFHDFASNFRTVWINPSSYSDLGICFSPITSFIWSYRIPLAPAWIAEFCRVSISNVCCNCNLERFFVSNFNVRIIKWLQACFVEKFTICDIAFSSALNWPVRRYLEVWAWAKTKLIWSGWVQIWNWFGSIKCKTNHWSIAYIRSRCDISWVRNYFRLRICYLFAWCKCGHIDVSRDRRSEKR